MHSERESILATNKGRHGRSGSASLRLRKPLLRPFGAFVKLEAPQDHRICSKQLRNRRESWLGLLSAFLRLSPLWALVQRAGRAHSSRHPHLG
jgi:hypothetical protein